MTVSDHLGNTFNTTIEMCRHYNISQNVFYTRHNLKRWSLEDTLTTPVRESRRKKPCKDHEGKAYPSINAMCQTYNLTPSLFHYRKKVLKWSLEDCLTTPTDNYKTDGNHEATKALKTLCQDHDLTLPQYRARLKNPNWSNEDALTQPKSARPHQKITDHLGNVFPTLTAMCQHYNIRLDTYRIRLKKDFSKEEALTYKPYQSTVITDHKGKSFASKTEMAEHYGLDLSTLTRRLSSGMTLEEALTKPLHKIITDPFGNTFVTIKKMAEHYGVSSSSISFYQNDPEKLTRLLEGKPVRTSVKDHKGTIFNGLNEMLTHYGIPYGVYRQRRKKLNWTLEKALTTPIRKKQNTFTDHKGNTYASLKNMAKAYAIDLGLLTTRLQHHWPIEKALTTPARKITKTATDHKGNTYASIKEMVDAYNISYVIYKQRLNHGWSKEKALTTPIQKKGRKH